MFLHINKLPFAYYIALIYGYLQYIVHNVNVLLHDSIKLCLPHFIITAALLWQFLVTIPIPTIHISVINLILFMEQAVQQDVMQPIPSKLVVHVSKTSNSLLLTLPTMSF